MFIVANFGLSNSPVLYGREIIDNKSESLGGDISDSGGVSTIVLPWL